MCLAIPMKVLELENSCANVEIGGLQKQVDVSLVPEVKVGDYVIVHAGFAISVWNEEEALKTLAMLEEIEKSAE